ncbi:MAG TPA: DNA-processing protein DprA [Patescibacteria group bacterium]|nr:DNA-processing protein DprA [Patescibacteria group bacterium]
MIERDFILAFSNSVGVGPKGFQKLLKKFGTARDAWENDTLAKYKEVGIGKSNFAKFAEFKKSFDIQNYLGMLNKARVTFIPYGDKYYPESLRKLDSPPIGLYVKGNKELLLSCHSELVSESRQNLSSWLDQDQANSSVIAVVGARKITSYGRQVTETLVSQLVSYGFIIVSGMALGVDGVAHQATLDANGSTIAVLGCGVDCPYPRENEKLYENILDKNGLIISEYPLGMPATVGSFPARNRIVSGLSSSVLITEAAEGSGSLITAEFAIKQGKTVFAVPGPITSQMSQGSLKLLKQGAILVSSVDDILSELRIKNHESGIYVIARSEATKQSLNADERKIFYCVQDEEKTIDEISRETKIPNTKLSVMLSKMELSGILKSSEGKFRV